MTRSKTKWEKQQMKKNNTIQCIMVYPWSPWNQRGLLKNVLCETRYLQTNFPHISNK